MVTLMLVTAGPADEPEVFGWTIVIALVGRLSWRMAGGVVAREFRSVRRLAAVAVGLNEMVRVQAHESRKGNSLLASAS
jgi:cytochrome b